MKWINGFVPPGAVALWGARGATGGFIIATVAALAACSSSDEPPPPVSVAVADNITVAWNGESRLGVLDNDTVREGTATLSVIGAPAHGRVSVAGGALSYTPTAGFYGEDSITYQLDVAAANGSPDARATSSAVVKLVVQAQITLQGVVSDGPLANAKVVATVGGQSFSADADAQGRYSLPITSIKGSDFVTLTATGAGAQSAVVLTSLVGEVSGLAAASKNNALTADVMPALMVTHVSAAQAGLMAQAGTLPSSNAELAAAGQKLDSLAVMDAAALVKLVVDAGVALPTGAATTRDMLASATLLNGFDSARRTADAAQLAGVRDVLLVDPALAVTPPLPGAAPGSAPVSLLYVYGAGGVSKAVYSFTLRPDGTATVVTDSARSSTWKLQGKAIRFDFDLPVVSMTYSAAVDSSGNQISQDSFRTGLTLAELGAHNGSYTLASVSTTGYNVDKTGPKAGIKQDYSYSKLVRRYADKGLPLLADDVAVGVRWAGLLSDKLTTDLSTSTSFKQDVLRITGAGTGRMERKAVDVTWQLADGALVVTIGTDRFRYRRLALGPLGEERWVVEQVDVAGQTGAVYEVMAVRASEVVVDNAGWSKRFLGNLFAGELRSEPFYTLKPDFTWTNTIKDVGSPESTATFTRVWRRLADGRLELVSTSSPAGCNPWVGVATCRISAQRFWTVLAQSGKTLFVMETGPNSPTQTINSWRFVAFTEAPPAAP